MIYLLLPTIAITSACATQSVEDCKTADWKSVGVTDGRRGLTERQLLTHRNTCLESGLEVDEIKYRQGRDLGLEEYCTPAGGYAAGCSGRYYEHVCPKNLEKAFLTNFAEGNKVRELEIKHDQAAKDLAAERKRIADDKSVVGDVANVFSLLSGKSRTASEEAREEELDDKLQKQKSLAPSGVENFRNDSLSTAGLRGYAGAVIGPLIGFGGGHAIQGTYQTTGWKWTAIDSAVITSLAVVYHNCPDGSTRLADGTRVQTSEPSSCSKVAVPIALLTFIGSRVWEGVGLWKHASVMASPYKYSTVSKVIPDSVTIDPRGEGLNANLSWNW